MRSVLLAMVLVEIGGAGYVDVVARLSPTASVAEGGLLFWTVVDLLLIRLDWLAAGVLVLGAVELVLLCSPPVRSHVRTTRQRRPPRAARQPT